VAVSRRIFTELRLNNRRKRRYEQNESNGFHVILLAIGECLQIDEYII